MPYANIFCVCCSCAVCCAVLCVPLRNGELDSALQGGNRIALVVLTRHWRQYMLGLCLCCCYCASCTSCSNNTTSIFIFITHSFCRFIMCCCCKSSSYFFTIFLILITGSTQVRQQNFEKRWNKKKNIMLVATTHWTDAFLCAGIQKRKNKYIFFAENVSRMSVSMNMSTQQFFHLLLLLLFCTFIWCSSSTLQKFIVFLCSFLIMHAVKLSFFLHFTLIYLVAHSVRCVSMFVCGSCMSEENENICSTQLCVLSIVVSTLSNDNFCSLFWSPLCGRCCRCCLAIYLMIIFFFSLLLVFYAIFVFIFPENFSVCCSTVCLRTDFLIGLKPLRGVLIQY